ncbi:MAG: hypothetical protein ACXVA9_11530, partial [Bdellovibrionales bacterium]
SEMPKIASYVQIMSLSPQVRMGYLTELAQALDVFEQNAANEKLSVVERSKIMARLMEIREQLALIPQANAAGLNGVPLITSRVNDGGRSQYSASCPDNYEWSENVGTCVVVGKTISKFSPGVSSNQTEYKAFVAHNANWCGNGTTMVNVGGFFGQSFSCVSNDALNLMSPERKAALIKGDAPYANAKRTDGGSGSVPMLNSAFGSAKSLEEQKKLAAQNVIESQIANGPKPAAAPGSDPQLTSGDKNACSAFKCTKSKSKAETDKRREEYKKVAGKKAACTIGGYVTTYSGGEVVAGGCQKKTQISLGGATAKCKASETLCNPTLYCKPKAAGAAAATPSETLQASVICVNPKKEKGEVQASCRSQHLAAWSAPRPEDGATSCVDNSSAQGLREVYEETIKSYNDLCFNKDNSASRDFFCSECGMLSERIGSANNTAFHNPCLVDSSGGTPADGDKSETTK